MPQREPMFPNYLFIYVDLEEVTPVTLKSTRGISRIIHFGKEWTPVSSQLIYRLMSRDDSDEARASYARLPTQGDKVLIESGPLAGFEAIYLEPDGETTRPGPGLLQRLFGSKEAASEAPPVDAEPMPVAQLAPPTPAAPRP